MTGGMQSERLAKLEPVVIDGEKWWKLQQVAVALRCPERCGKYVRQEHKRRQYEYHPGYRSKVVTLIDRRGVEQLVIKYHTVEARWEIMAALDAATQ